MVLLHGLFGSSRNWTGIAKRLGEGFDVHALDLRNHGDSPWTDGVDYPAMATDVLAYMDAHGLDRPILVGHSMGGKVAMCLALLHPARIGPLVVADIAPVPYDTGRERYIEAMKAVPVGQLSRRSEADTHLAEAVPDWGTRQFLLQNLVDDGAGAYRWRINLAVLESAMDAIVGFPDLGPDHGGAPFEGPCLFIRGDRSDYVVDAHRPVIEALFPRTRLITIKDAGHLVHAEKPDAFLSILTGFLSRVE
ncbi:MAG: alpha/beta fold hydrolase [Rhodospirillum sp.]|nr:alpha/beta fold hydrolase [Rhodospirillum sp.]MCF8489342.1 alpha/beta fold hydrolase [Rhodospirillum sp.]MCF8503001.1 alpha/beta fold hydrolase [Rhodospirillum sp.]